MVTQPSLALKQKLTVAISSRALFNLDESHHIFEKQGVAAYCQYQIKQEKRPLEPGVAFSLVKKLLNLKDPKTEESLTEVVLLSRNSADTGLRVFNSILHHNLPITRAAFTNGSSGFHYLSAFGSQLFLSANHEDVQNALQAGYAAATIFPTCAAAAAHTPELRMAFDGDAVLVSDEAERVYQEKGLDEFTHSEAKKAMIPLSGGPFKPFLLALHNIQKRFSTETCPIRTALVTARQAPAHERLVRTLRAWDIRIDEALFLGGLNKGEFLNAFAADFYFDDQRFHCEEASQYVATGHVNKI